MNTRKPIFIANWKMNKSVGESKEFIDRLSSLLADIPSSVLFDVVIAPSAAHLSVLGKSLDGKTFRLGAQNCGTAKSGSFTGEISPVVLKELGVDSVIVGHSERRHVFHEDDSLIVSRAKAALEEGINVVFCVGEVLEDRKLGKTFAVVESQLASLKQLPLSDGVWKRLAIAYEPVWAIGTGENATPAQAQEVHAFIRDGIAERFSAGQAANTRILYGGSVKPDNSAQIMVQKDVDGLLVGTSSLDPAVFAGVIKNGLKSRT